MKLTYLVIFCIIHFSNCHSNSVKFRLFNRSIFDHNNYHMIHQNSINHPSIYDTNQYRFDNNHNDQLDHNFHHHQTNDHTNQKIDQLASQLNAKYKNEFSNQKTYATRNLTSKLGKAKKYQAPKMCKCQIQKMQRIVNGQAAGR